MQRSLPYLLGKILDQIYAKFETANNRELKHRRF